MPWALIGDVANVVWIKALRSPPLIVDGSREAKPALDRTFGLRPRLIGLAPAEFLPEVDHRTGALNDLPAATGANRRWIVMPLLTTSAAVL